MHKGSCYQRWYVYDPPPPLKSYPYFNVHSFLGMAALVYHVHDHKVLVVRDLADGSRQLDEWPVHLPDVSGGCTRALVGSGHVCATIHGVERDDDLCPGQSA